MIRGCQIVILLVGVLLASCKKDSSISVEPNDKFVLPRGFPPITYPADNEFRKDRWDLGKKLFFDKSLSRGNKISCASCHKLDLAFSDDVALSVGENNLTGKSNSPTLANIAYHPYYTRAGGVPTLEMQVLVPIQEHDEFDFNIVDIASLLRSDSSYNQAARNCYGRNIDPYVIVRAIANYERTITSGNSFYDQNQWDKRNFPFTALQQEGKELFFSSRTNCALCHSGFNFTNYSFQSNGLYLNYADSGRMRLTHLESDRALFKVPTLRNIAITKPYMHNGSVNSLEDVIQHYNSGGFANTNKSKLIKPLGLMDGEKRALVAFLNTLTDYDLINNEKFKQ